MSGSRAHKEELGSRITQYGSGNAAIVGDITNASVTVVAGGDVGVAAFLQSNHEYVDRYIKDPFFTSRREVKKELGGFISTVPCGVLVLEGGPGTGKSGFMAELATRPEVVLHRSEIGDSLLGALNILAQVHQSIDGGAGDLSFPYTPMFELVQRELHRAIDRRARQTSPLLICIDAPSLPSDLVNHGFYGLPAKLPNNVYLIIASRPGVRLPAGWQRRVISATSERCLDDLRAYIVKRLQDRISPVDLVRESEQVLMQCGGSWLLASLLLDGDPSVRPRESIVAPETSYRAKLAAHLASNLTSPTRKDPTLLGVVGLCCWSSIPVDLRSLADALNVPQTSLNDLVKVNPGCGVMALGDASSTRLELRHDTIRAIVLDPPVELLSEERETIDEVRRQGYAFANMLADRLEGRGEPRLRTLHWALHATSAVASGDRAGIVRSLLPSQVGDSTSRHPSSSSLQAFANHVYELWQLSCVDHAMAITALVGSALLESSHLGHLDRLGPYELAAMVDKGSINAEQVAIALDRMPLSTRATALMALMREPDSSVPSQRRPGMIGVSGEAQWRQQLPSLLGDLDLATALQELLEGLKDETFLEVVKSLTAVTNLPPLNWRGVIASREDSYSILKAVALALKQESVVADRELCDYLRLEANVHVLRLPDLARARAVADLYAADSDYDEWVNLLADIVAFGRLNGPVITRTRSLNIVASVVPRALQVALADEAIALAAHSPKDTIRLLPSESIRMASPTGVRHCIAMISEKRISKYDIAWILADASLNPDPEAMRLALAAAEHLPGTVRGIATIPLRSALGLDDEAVDASIADFDELDGVHSSTAFHWAAQQPELRPRLRAIASRRDPDRQFSASLVALDALAERGADDDWVSEQVTKLARDRPFLWSSRSADAILRHAPLELMREVQGALRRNDDGDGLSASIVEIACSTSSDLDP